MSQLIITLKDAEKINLLQDFLESIDYVEQVEVFEKAKTNLPVVNEDALLYTPSHSYTVEDLEAIKRQFPETHPWTYSDLYQYFPHDLKIKIEIINNELFIMASPSKIHQDITFELCSLMKRHNKKHKLGEVMISPFDVILEENNVVVPDIVFISIQNIEILSDKNAKGSPDLLVEVWSPGNSKAERERKRNLYEEKGVQEFWAIFPKEKKVSVEAFNPDLKKYELLCEAVETGNVFSKVLKGFTLDLEDIFES